MLFISSRPQCVKRSTFLYQPTNITNTKYIIFIITSTSFVSLKRMYHQVHWIVVCSLSRRSDLTPVMFNYCDVFHFERLHRVRRQNSLVGDVKRASWCLKSLTTRLYVQELVQANIEEHRPHYWHFVRESTSGFYSQKSGNAERVSISWRHRVPENTVRIIS